MTQAPPVIEALSAELIAVRDRMREISSEERELSKRKEELQYRLMQAMDAVGTSAARANNHSITINETMVASMSDYDEFTTWLIDQLQTHPEYIALFERRISAPMYRELLDELGGEDIPGLTPFNKRTISLRTLS